MTDIMVPPGSTAEDIRNLEMAAVESWIRQIRRARYFLRWDEPGFRPKEIPVSASFLELLKQYGQEHGIGQPFEIVGIPIVVGDRR